MYRSTIAAMVVIALALGAAAAHAGHSASSANAVDPSSFTSPVANPYYPLIPGRVTVLRGSKDGIRLVNRVTTTHHTKVIQGVSTTVIHDIVFEAGRLRERTTDWYAADNTGNVWYFGERTATYDPNGNVDSTEGTWQAGVDGAVAGIIMPADPRPTDAYRQEFLRGHAEDQAWIVQRGTGWDIPYGHVDQVVRSFEWTRLEPRVMSLKLYAPGLGIVLETDVAGGTEHLALVRVTG